MQKSSIEFIVLIISVVIFPAISATKCTHPIFCNEKILAKVAESRIFSDSKQFVDLLLKVSVEDAQKSFESVSV